MFRCFIVLFSWFCLSEQIFVHSAVTDDDRPSFRPDVRLYNQIMESVRKSEEPYLRPAGMDISTPVEVKLNLDIIRLSSFNEETGLIKTLCWLEQIWNDRNIGWNPDEFGGIKKMSLPSADLWKPDITLYNSLSGKTAFDESIRLVVHHDGMVDWDHPIETETDCDLNNGTWTCVLTFGSWTYDGHEVSLNGSPTVSLSYLRSPPHGWKIMSAKAKTETLHDPCCPEPYPLVTFEVTLGKE